MKKTLYALVLVLTVSHLHAKMGVYDPDVVMSQSKELNEWLASVDRDFKKKFDDMKKEEDTLRTQATKFQEKTALLNETAREQEQDSLMRKKRDLDTKAERCMEDYKVERQKVAMRFLKKLEESLDTFAQEQGFELIIPRGPGLYASDKTDQTEVLVGYMNKNYEEKKVIKKA
jgi:Skp family chaperone for outer membrane proteins